MRDIAADIRDSVRLLKVERDTWHAMADQYKAAFETQTARLQQLQDICFAAQAELENERAHHRKLQESRYESQREDEETLKSPQTSHNLQLFGTANITVNPDSGCSNSRANPVFLRVQRFFDQQNYSSALLELERLLRGPLSPKARAEGLLLKSSILQAAGPDELYDALAACSEALELCDRLSELETFLPKIQYERGVLYYQLRMLDQARDAFDGVSKNHMLYAAAKEYSRSCDNELEIQRNKNRRSGFDENRAFNGGMVVQLDEKLEKQRRRTSAQSRLRAAARAKRQSLSQRYVGFKSDSI